MRFAYIRSVRLSAAHSQPNADATCQAMLSSLLLLTALLLVPSGVSAWTQDPATCVIDGVTEMPPFAMGRDQDGCLLLDPGNGDPPVKIQHENYHGVGTNGGANHLTFWGPCPGGGQTQWCTTLVWDTVYDNFIADDRQNQDVWNMIGGGNTAELLYIKDSYILNGWKCNLISEDWWGPNDLFCSTADTSGNHTDVFQSRGAPSNNGWFIFQDSVIANGVVRIQNQADDFGNGLFQGLQIGGFEDPRGAYAAENGWLTECVDRFPTLTKQDCIGQLSFVIGRRMHEAWAVDVTGNIRMGFPGLTEKVVIVSTATTPVYQNGWIYPLKSSGLPSGPGTCPEGLIMSQIAGKYGSFNIYCYTSLEAARDDVSTGSSTGVGDCPATDCPHKMPPFVHLSASGWENPPPTSTVPLPRPPLPPFLLSDDLPPPPAPSSPQAAIVGFALWDAQADGLIDANFTSGEVISLAAHGCTAIEVLGNAYLATSNSGSVTFSFDGQDLGGCSGVPGLAFENTAPYTWEEDSGAGSFECAASLTQPGSHSLTVTPFDGDNCSGLQGTSVTLDFEVQ